MSSDWQEHHLIFPSSVGTPFDPRNLLRAFKNLLKKAGFPDMRFHDLRHTAATLMLLEQYSPHCGFTTVGTLQAKRNA